MDEQVDKFKVTFFIGGTPDNISGLELMLLEYYKHADKSQYEISIVHTSENPQFGMANSLKKIGVPEDQVTVIKDLDSKFSFMLDKRILKLLYYGIFRPVSSYLFYIFSLKKTLQKEIRSDVVYLFTNELNGYLYGFKGLVIGHNGMWVIKDNALSYKLIKNKLLWRRIDGFRLFPHNRKYAEKLNRSYSFVLQNGIDTSFFTLPKNPRTWPEVRFIFVGRLDKGKGFDMVIPAYIKISKNINCSIDIAGNGEFERIIPNGEKTNIRYHGKLDRKKIVELYKNTDILVLPSRWDPYPTVVFEALSSGLGVVVTDSVKGAYDEFEKLGMLRYTKLTVDDLTSNMEAISKDLPNIRKLSEKSHHMMETQFDVDVVTEKLFRSLKNQYIKAKTNHQDTQNQSYNS